MLEVQQMGPHQRKITFAPQVRQPRFLYLFPPPVFANPFPHSASRKASERSRSRHQMGTNAAPWPAGMPADSCPKQLNSER